MRRAFLLLLAMSLVLFGACRRPPDPEVDKPKAAPSPTETPDQTFELEGTVLEASGSASVVGTETETTTRTTSPSPTKTASPTGKATGSPSPASTETTTTTTTEIVKGAPGSIAVKLKSYSSEVSGCSFKENDTLVVAYTSTTSFDPADLTDDKSFPNNLKNRTIKISGVITSTDAGDCLLVAKSVTVEAAASPTGKATTGRTSSPSPTRTASPSPTGT